jgi:lysozyme
MFSPFSIGASMKIGPNGLALIKEFEGYHKRLSDGRCKAYLDKLPRPALWSKGYNGLWTIGWGSTGKNVTEDTVWTRAQAETSLRGLAESHEQVVERLVKLPLNQSQFDALVSLSYNVGLHKCKTLVSLVNKGEFAKAADAFLMYDKAGGVSVSGLRRRRKAERKLFLSAPDAVTSALVKDTQESSTKLTMLVRIRLFLASLGIGSYLSWENITEARQFASDHLGFVLLGVGAIVWLISKYVEYKSAQDRLRGTYVPSKLVEQGATDV